MFGSKLCERGMLGSKNTIISREKQWPTSNLCSFQQMSTVQLSERAFCKDFKHTQQNQRVPRKIPRMRAALWENKQYVHISMASAAFVDFITWSHSCSWALPASITQRGLNIHEFVKHQMLSALTSVWGRWDLKTAPNVALTASKEFFRCVMLVLFGEHGDRSSVCGDLTLTEGEERRLRGIRTHMWRFYLSDTTERLNGFKGGDSNPGRNKSSLWSHTVAGVCCQFQGQGMVTKWFIFYFFMVNLRNWKLQK